MLARGIIADAGPLRADARPFFLPFALMKLNGPA